MSKRQILNEKLKIFSKIKKLKWYSNGYFSYLKIFFRHLWMRFVIVIIFCCLYFIETLIIRRLIMKIIEKWAINKIIWNYSFIYPIFQDQNFDRIKINSNWFFYLNCFKLFLHFLEFFSLHFIYQKRQHYSVKLKKYFIKVIKLAGNWNSLLRFENIYILANLFS